MAFADLIAKIDRAVQVNLGGQSITYKPELGTPVVVQGIFDERYRLADPGHPGVETIQPAVAVRLEDLPTDPRNEDPMIEVDGVDYTVVKRETDGVGGLVVLILRRAGL